MMSSFNPIPLPSPPSCFFPRFFLLSSSPPLSGRPIFRLMQLYVCVCVFYAVKGSLALLSLLFYCLFCQTHSVPLPPLAPTFASTSHEVFLLCVCRVFFSSSAWSSAVGTHSLFFLSLTEQMKYSDLYF